MDAATGERMLNVQSYCREFIGKAYQRLRLNQQRMSGHRGSGLGDPGLERRGRG
jgi:hypothetical protein